MNKMLYMDFSINQILLEIVTVHDRGARRKRSETGKSEAAAAWGNKVKWTGRLVGVARGRMKTMRRGPCDMKSTTKS